MELRLRLGIVLVVMEDTWFRLEIIAFHKS